LSKLTVPESSRGRCTQMDCTALDHVTSRCLFMTKAGIDSRKHVVANVFHGAGPHFCPGGNPLSTPTPASTAFSTVPYTGFVAQLRIRAPTKSVICAMHGFVLGGGLAMSMTTDFRGSDSLTTISLRHFGFMQRPVFCVGQLKQPTTIVASKPCAQMPGETWGRHQFLQRPVRRQTVDTNRALHP